MLIELGVVGVYLMLAILTHGRHLKPNRFCVLLQPLCCELFLSLGEYGRQL